MSDGGGQSRHNRGRRRRQQKDPFSGVLAVPRGTRSSGYLRRVAASMGAGLGAASFGDAKKTAFAAGCASSKRTITLLFIARNKKLRFLSQSRSRRLSGSPTNTAGSGTRVCGRGRVKQNQLGLQQFKFGFFERERRNANAAVATSTASSLSCVSQTRSRREL